MRNGMDGIEGNLLKVMSRKSPSIRNDRIEAINDYQSEFETSLMMTMIKSIHVRGGRLMYDDCVSDFSLVLDSIGNLRQALRLMYVIALSAMSDEYLKENLPDSLLKKVIPLIDVRNDIPYIRTVIGSSIQLDAKAMFNASVTAYGSLGEEDSGISKVSFRDEGIDSLVETPYMVKY